jgi:GcrA cell cycle regulator
MMRQWTPEMNARLTAMWAASLTAAAIASIMGDGITRNAIIGKVFRLGLSKRKPGPPRQPKKAKPAPKQQRRRIVRPVPVPEFVALEARSEPWEPLPGSVPISILSLTDAVCRWPVGGDHRTPGTGFCGCPVATGRVYCAEHYATSVGNGTPSERGALKAARVVARMAA